MKLEDFPRLERVRTALQLCRLARYDWTCQSHSSYSRERYKGTQTLRNVVSSTDVLELFQSRPFSRYSLILTPHLTSESNTISRTTIFCHYPAFQQYVSAYSRPPCNPFTHPGLRTTVLAAGCMGCKPISVSCFFWLGSVMVFYFDQQFLQKCERNRVMLTYRRAT